MSIHQFAQSNHGARALICAIAVLFALTAARADEEAEIVTTCHFANMEWGSDMIDRCVRENHATRAAVLAYPQEHQRAITRCRAKSELGWALVKDCVDRDIEAGAALSQYPQHKGELIAVCSREFAPLGALKIKSCVDEAGEAPRRTNEPTN